MSKKVRQPIPREFQPEKLSFSKVKTPMILSAPRGAMYFNGISLRIKIENWSSFVENTVAFSPYKRKLFLNEQGFIEPQKIFGLFFWIHLPKASRYIFFKMKIKDTKKIIRGKGYILL